MSEVHRIREAVFARAEEKCECGCGRSISYATGRLDHVFGRAKTPQSVQNCWALAMSCDENKTANRPNATYWLVAFALHALKHGYLEESGQALGKISVLAVKGLTP